MIHEAKVVTYGADDDVDGIAGATFEITAAEMAPLLSYVRSPPRWRSAA
jgi:hypothetical protein